MRGHFIVLSALVAVLATPVMLAAEDPEKPHAYTREDLDRMFGPVPSGPSQTAPIAKSTPDDWRAVMDFINHEHALIDAERQYEAERQQSDYDRETSSYSGYSGWMLGYPYYGYYGVGHYAGSYNHRHDFHSNRPMFDTGQSFRAHQRDVSLYRGHIHMIDRPFAPTGHAPAFGTGHHR